MRWYGWLSMPLGIGICIVYAAAHLIGSPTPSIAAGWYWRHSGKPTVSKGQLVLLEPSADVRTLIARIAPGYEALPWVKRIIGLDGDMVCYGERITVNGTDYGPRPLRETSVQVPVEEGCQSIAGGHVLVLGTHPYSFDGRYVGPMPVTQLQANVSPVWTWERHP